MGIKILQVNVKNWGTNKYNFQVMCSQHNPDIILLNETSLPVNKTTNIRGFTSIDKANGQYTGVSLLIKTELKFEKIITSDDTTIAIKLFTTYGTMIIATAYVPPREVSLPTISLNKIFSNNAPTILIGDLNAHHPMLDNESVHVPLGDGKGKQIHRLATLKNINYLGPAFKTYVTRRARGKPDVILANREFDIFHYKIESGEHFGSDHIPIIVTIQAQPFKVLIKDKTNINTLNIKDYQEELKQLPMQDLNNKPASEINKATDKLIEAINKATSNHSQKHTTKVIKCYEPTELIKRKLNQYSSACMNYYRFGAPNAQKLKEMLNNTRELISQHKSELWTKVVQTATDAYGQPQKFWNRIKQLKSDPKDKIIPTLTRQYTVDDSEDSEFGEEITEHITDPQEQADLMSSTWSKVFQPQKGPEFHNNNTKMVELWYKLTKPKLRSKTTINFDELIPDHPLMRPIEQLEVNSSIAHTKNKAPGISGITPQQIKALPSNCRVILKEIYDSILATGQFPDKPMIIKMIFIRKPGKDPSNPLSYRPICLLEIILKIFERIIAQRLLYYLEYNNLLTEKQFGFRSGRCTQHSINFVDEIINENKKQRKSTLVATRDTEKAFDTVWEKGLLFKFNRLPCSTEGLLVLLHNFMTKRIIIPHMSDKLGKAIIPRAGVPQGSCIGPILYLLFVNDHPQPVFKDTVITQFADDIVHVVSSSIKRKTKAKIKSLQFKAEKELKQTLEWERNWRKAKSLSSEVTKIQ